MTQLARDIAQDMRTNPYNWTYGISKSFLVNTKFHQGIWVCNGFWFIRSYDMRFVDNSKLGTVGSYWMTSSDLLTTEGFKFNLFDKFIIRLAYGNWKQQARLDPKLLELRQ